ncbi:MAG: universal stress protein [Chloroflexi bacterium]|nr:universal stress protein [Chloroflexota bacterium]
MFNTILVCLDGSRLAEQVLPYAEAEAVAFKSRVILFQAVPEPEVVTPGIPGTQPVPVETGSMLQRARQALLQAESYLEKTAGPLIEKGLPVDTAVIVGRAGEVIVNYARENAVDLIAMASHGRSGLSRAIFGSVADYVLREGGLPVLVIRPLAAG